MRDIMVRNVLNGQQREAENMTKWANKSRSQKAAGNTKKRQEEKR